MTRGMIFPLMLGVLGTAILLALGVWQVQRLQWKQDVLARIEERIAAPPGALPEAPQPEADRYRPVEVSGRFAGPSLRVLASERGLGPGFHVIAAFETDTGRRVMVDRGFVPDSRADDVAPGGTARITGNLHWPREVDSFTPEPDAGRNLWFARDVPSMAAALETEEVLIVARRSVPAAPPLRPAPVSTAGIPNNHLEYAITWFSLALVWVGMTAFWLWRIRRKAE